MFEISVSLSEKKYLYLKEQNKLHVFPIPKYIESDSNLVYAFFSIFNVWVESNDVFSSGALFCTC